ncbi:hypothetical protein BMETH_1557_1 [methanotrophic bacterial endosymbiont of Bathymodiolus sp.]|nr:hypothetical protein BMETH_1557_1 [methanotrophic bacterial endosymbiont of Bathymodiolus sp.]
MKIFPKNVIRRSLKFLAFRLQILPILISAFSRRNRIIVK